MKFYIVLSVFVSTVIITEVYLCLLNLGVPFFPRTMDKFVKELADIEKKVDLLSTLISDYEGDGDHQRRINFLLSSIKARIGLAPITDENRASIEVLLEQLAILTKRYETMEEAVGVRNEGPPFVPDRRVKCVPVAKWGIHFNGNDLDMSLGSFLERIEELCTARNVSKDCLWSEAVDLFQGTALVWFRSMRRRINSWDELTVELRKQFQPSDYDNSLLQEIRARTQGEAEPIGLYIAAMDNLFCRLSFNVPEAEQLGIIKQNLQPFLSEKLCLQELSSIEKLCSLGRRVEENMSLSRKFRSPPPAKLSLEPDLAYRGMVKPRAQLEVIHTAAEVDTLGGNDLPNPSATCWNCKERGHRFKQCPRPRGNNVFCYKCGKVGATLGQCQNSRCKQAGNADGLRD